MEFHGGPSAGRSALWLAPSVVAVLALSYLGDPVPATSVAVVVPAVLAFMAWVRWPAVPPEVFAGIVLASVTGAIWGDSRLEGSLFLVVLMVLSVAWSWPTVARPCAVAAAATLLPVGLNLSLGDDIGWEAWAAASLFTFALGRLLHRQAVLIADLRNARDELAEQAVLEERRRIARELHDLAGHTLAAVLLHVTGARHVLRRDIDEAERALIDAEGIGRASLDQIRAAVEVLRADERGTDAPLADAGDLDQLVDQYRRAGLAIDATIEPPVAELRGPAGVAVHRIVREALANVARHAPANAVALRAGLSDTGDGIVVVVEDHGRRPAPLPSSARRFGLVGMAERARAVGGELATGPTDDGWAVELRLPQVPA